MTTVGAVDPVASSAVRDAVRPAVLRATVRRDRPGLAAVVAVQAVVFTLAAAPGYFSTDDLAFLADARPVAPTWSYLTLAVNDHLSPGLRLTFWLTRHLIGLHHGPTVVARVVLLAGLALLAHHVLVQLVGRRPLTLVLTAAFALNPVLLTTALWFTTAVNQLPSQLLALTALSAHIRFVRTGRWVHAATAGAALFLAACFWEPAALTGVVFVLLSTGFLNPGPARERLRRTVGQWRGWVLEVAGPVAFAAVFAVGGYGARATLPSPAAVLHGAWVQWSATTAPSLLGGPWRWSVEPGNDVSATDPHLVGVVAVQVLAVAVVAAGWRRLGPRVLYAVATPAAVVLLGFAVLALGRLSVYGLLISRLTRYGLITVFPTLLLVALALGWPADPPGRAVHLPTLPARWRRPLAAATVVVLVVSCATSVSSFATTWHRNPTGPYVATLERSLRDAGPDAQVFDVPVTPRVLPVIFERRELSLLTDLLGARVDFVPVGSGGLMADDTGRLRPAVFYRYATAPGDGNPFCGNLVRGVTTRAMPLDRPRDDDGPYVVRLAYFDEHPTPVTVELTAPDGTAVAPLSGSSVTLPGTAGVVYLSFPPAAAAGVTVRSEVADANVCLTDVGIGYPFVRSGT